MAFDSHLYLATMHAVSQSTARVPNCIMALAIAEDVWTKAELLKRQMLLTLCTPKSCFTLLRNLAAFNSLCDYKVAC